MSQSGTEDVKASIVADRARMARTQAVTAQKSGGMPGAAWADMVWAASINGKSKSMEVLFMADSCY